MQTLVIVSHPQVDDSPTQQFLKASAAPLKDVVWHELDGNLPFDVKKEQALVRQSQRLIFQFPFYWYSAPASLHQWLQDVFTAQFAYPKTRVGVANKQLGLVVSLGQPLATYQIGAESGYGLSELLSPFAALARKCRLDLQAPLTIEQFSYQTQAQHQQLLISYQQYLAGVGPHFKDQADWWLAQLAEKAKDSSKAALVLQQLQQNQADLTSLNQAIAEMKAGDGLE